jgi:hypothetical protein
MQLADLQRQFQECVLDKSATVYELCNDDPEFPVAQRFGIYLNAYHLRLVAALKESFEHTYEYLGSDQFVLLAGEYVEHYPSHFANINDYGNSFPMWVKDAQTLHPELFEIAKLDWQMRRVFDGENSVPLTFADLAKIQPEQWESVLFQLVPTCRLLSLEFNTLAIWHAVDTGTDCPMPCLNEFATQLIVWRIGYQPHFRSVSDFEAKALRYLMEGFTFTNLCEALQREFPSTNCAESIGGLLRQWISEELLAA